MKSFIKYTLATICGLIIFTFIAVFIFFVSIASMGSPSSATTTVKENSVFVLKLDGTVQERSGEGTPIDFILEQNDMSVMGLDDILSSIKKAKAHPDIKGIYLEGGLASFDSPATAQQIRDALKDFKKSGKWVIAYGDTYTQQSYYVASVADTIMLNVTGMIELKGIGGKREFMTGLYEKLGVRYQAVRVGKYKSAVESVTRKDMSPENREQTIAYQQGIWNHMLKDIAESRPKLTAEKLDQMVSDSILAFAAPSDYLKGGLVDLLFYPEGVKPIIKGLLKTDDDEINQLMLSDMIAMPSPIEEKGDEIAVYYAYGEIIDQNTSMFSTDHNIIGKETVADLNKLAKDDDVKAVVIRVNSPGGSAVASEQIAHAITQLKAKKPVVISMGGLAASGGYMISAYGDYIFAEPTTITGSIGIFGLIPNFTGLATDKLGVTFDGTKTNQYTDFEENLIFSNDNAQEIRFMQTYVDRGYDTFLNLVADGRKMTREQVHEIAQGRVWLATDALPIKLVDKLGSLDDAVKKAADLAKLDEYHAKSYPEPATWYESLLDMVEKHNSYLDSELHELLGTLYQPLLDARRDQQRNRLQARLPYLLNF
ncbi:MAG: signal peptide peptidase SppA [Bacteroidales bacterium]|nr:signal peptide peptidase SppA [Prevotella sp.]MBR6843728.1 signal peptide peptidase SppA [Bacteroidales bacterium]